MQTILNKAYGFGKEKFVPLSFDEKSFVMEWTVAKGGGVPEHIHKYMDEEFLIVKGPLHISMNGEKFIRQSGESILVPKNVPHSVSNKNDHEVVCRVTYLPCDDTARMFWIGEQLNQLRPKAKNNFMVQMWLARQMGLHEFSSPNPESAAGRFIFWLMWRILGAMAFFGGWRKFRNQVRI
jgi:quercetin dioxygenase-like cupin family protein